MHLIRPVPRVRGLRRVSDGTEAGTGRASDVAPGARSSSPAELTIAGDRLCFAADDAAAGGQLFAVLAELSPARSGTPRLRPRPVMCASSGAERGGSAPTASLPAADTRSRRPSAGQ
jgi:hypothetical protein